MPKTLSTATLDRLLHDAHVCQTNGESVLQGKPRRPRGEPLELRTPPHDGHEQQQEADEQATAAYWAAYDSQLCGEHVFHDCIQRPTEQQPAPNRLVRTAPPESRSTPAAPRAEPPEPPGHQAGTGPEADPDDEPSY